MTAPGWCRRLVHGVAAADDGAWLVRLALLAVMASVVFLALPRIDLWGAGLFADASGRFAHARHPFLLFVNDLVERLAVVVIVAAVAGLGVGLWRRRPAAGLAPRAYAFVLLSVAIGPGLVANGVFKELWGRARPRQVAEFGGDRVFTAAPLPADQCATNCSFVSGDASMAFSLLALALLAPARWRPTAVVLSLLVGVGVGAVRVIQGAHFPSDVVFAGIVVASVVVALKMVVLDGRFGVADRTMAAARAMPGGAATLARRLVHSAPARQVWHYLAPGLTDLGLPPPADDVGCR